MAVCPHTDSSGSRLCPPGDVSDHPRRVYALVRGGDGAPRQLRHLRRPQARRLRGGEAAPCSPGLPPPPPVGRAQAVPGRTTVPPAVGPAARPELPPRVSQNPADHTARLCSHPSSEAGPPPPRRATPARAARLRRARRRRGRPELAGAIAPSGLSSCLPGKTSCVKGLCEALAVPSQPRHLFSLVHN